MEAAESRRLQNPDAAESQVNMNDVENRSSSAQLCDYVKVEICTDDEPSGSEGHEPSEDQQQGEKEFQNITVKVEGAENDYHSGGAWSSEEQLKEDKATLYCELCKSFFINKCELHGPALFIPDTPVPMGVPDRARKTLPAGLEVQKSGVPDAGLGVFNKGQTLPVGAHFGPYQGDLVEREEAMNSGYSWVLYRSRKCEEYIDAKREMNANWMRFVNCARNDEEQNLVAFQYGGGILYRSCRPVEPGQELLVWYEEEYAKDLSITFHHIWNRKSSADGINEVPLKCSSSPHSYTSQAYSHKHTRQCHYEEVLRPGEIQYESRQTSSDSLGQFPKQIHHCSDCGKNFTQLRYLRAHQRIHTGERPYTCSECGMSFNQMTNLKIHQRHHTGEKPYQCSECEKRFTRQISLKTHQRIHTGEKPYHCTQCGMSFNQQSNLRSHQRIHTGEKPYPCSQCGKKFTNQTTLKIHQRIHTGEKPYQCSKCGESFTYQYNLQSHQLIHTGEKPFKCSECGKTFTRLSHLQIHQRIHTGEKPYQCSQCGKSFSERGTLKKHERIHTGEKPYHCSECGESFTSQYNLQSHVLVHTGEKPYHCSYCEKSFTRLSHLQAHQRIHTGEKPYQCSQCERSFSQTRKLKAHKCRDTEPPVYHV